MSDYNVIFCFLCGQYIIVEIVVCFYVLKFIQIKYIFLRVTYYLKIKIFTFSCL